MTALLRLSRTALPLLTALIACALTGSAAAQEPVKIGLSGPFTGGSSSMGVSMRDGVRLATEEINAKGGIDIGGVKRPILLVERDDQAKNTLGVQIASELIHDEKVIATIGYINTGVALSSQRLYQRAEIPVMNNVATGTLVTMQFDPPSYIFRNSCNDSIQSAMIVDEAIARRGLKRVAIFADTTAYGFLGAADLMKALMARDVIPVTVEKFNVKDTDMTAQLQSARDAGAEAIQSWLGLFEQGPGVG